MTVVADRHVIIVNAGGTFLPSGPTLTGPVTSVEKLEKLLVWARGSRGLLTPRTDDRAGAYAPAQLWFTGSSVRHLLSNTTGAGDSGGQAEITEQLGQALGVLVGRGWKIGGGGAGRLLLAHPGPPAINVEILIAETPWLLPDARLTLDSGEAAAALGGRINQWAVELGELPTGTPASSAAVVFTRIMHARNAPDKKAAAVTAPGWLPDDVLAETRIQQPWAPDSEAVERAFDQASDLVWMEQEAPLLSSAGMITLGYGQPVTFTGAAATKQAHQGKLPFGLWLAEIPALDLPTGLPPIHPAITDPTRPTQAWLTTEDLTGLGKEIRDGGAGLHIDQISITEALVWPHQGRLLESWAKRLRQAREHFATDPTMLTLIDTATAGFFERLADPDSANDPVAALQYQPAWAAAVSAHTRQRVRRTALRISREFHVWPLYLHDTAAAYALPHDPETGHGIDIADTHTRLGRLRQLRRVTIDDTTILSAVIAETPHQLAEALTAALDIDPPAEPAEPSDPPANTPTTDASVALEDAAAHTDLEGAAPQPESQENQPPTGPRRRAVSSNRKASGKQGKGPEPTYPGGIPAAVLHTDGLWLPGGAKVDLPEHICHAGQVAELAYDNNIGYRQSPTYSEAPQIWITRGACMAFGIPVEAIAPRDRTKSLHQITEGIDFVTLAVAQGWAFGGVKDDEAPRLGPWTRVFRHRDPRPGVMLALIPGMEDDEATMPILAADNPTPAQIATRLQRLADVLKFPWKINAGVTAVDLMLQARPKTWKPKDWRNVVFGPSTTEVPYALTDIEQDFNWSRPPTEEEATLTYVHAYDRGGSYAAAIAGTELPIGEPEHHEGNIDFDPKLPGYWLTLIPEPSDWRYPYLLNPRGYPLNEPRWITTPRLERAIELGYEPEFLEAIVWPEHGRILLEWYNRLRDAHTTLDTTDPDDRAARSQAKVIRTHGVGIMGSDEYLKGKTGYDPARRFHIMAKANSNIVYRIHQIGQATRRWPLAVITDTVLYASDDPNPDTAWPGKPEQYGRGFGQYKPERSGLLAEHREYLTGNGYRGKALLTEMGEWRTSNGLESSD